MSFLTRIIRSARIILLPIMRTAGNKIIQALAIILLTFLWFHRKVLLLPNVITSGEKSTNFDDICFPSMFVFPL